MSRHGPAHDLTVGEILRAVRGETGAGSGQRVGARTADVQATLDSLEGAWCEVADRTSLDELARGTGLPTGLADA